MKKIKWTLSILKDTSRGTGVKWAKAKKTNLVLSKSNGHGPSHQSGPPYYDLLKNSIKIILLKKKFQQKNVLNNYSHVVSRLFFFSKDVFFH